ncbi:cytochrome-ba3 oxidase subunit [Halobacteriaceae archaeon GCM10025711]
MELSLRIVPVVGLLALVPALLFAFGRTDVMGYVAALNTVLIAASLYYMFGPADSEFTAGSTSESPRSDAH